MNNAAFVEAARKYIGTRWQDRGRSVNGLDCIGLIALAARDAGWDEPYHATLHAKRDYHSMKPVLCQFAQRMGQAELGSILLYKADMVLHLAIATTPGNALHALGPKTSVMESTINFPVRQVWGIKWPS